VGALSVLLFFCTDLSYRERKGIVAGVGKEFPSVNAGQFIDEASARREVP